MNTGKPYVEYREAIGRDAGVTLRITDRPANDGVTRTATLAALLAATERALPTPDPDAAAVIVALPGGDGAAEVVRLSHKTLAAQADGLARALQLDADDVVAATLAPGAPVAVLEMLFPIINGACALIVSDDARDDGDLLVEELADARASVIVGDSSVWQQILATDWKGAPNCRAIVVAGALPTASELAELSSRVSTSFTLFGLPTDGGALAVEAIRGTDGCSHVGMAGLAGTRIDVVDADGERSQVGLPGWLRVARGAHVRVTGVRARLTLGGRVQLLRGDPEVSVSRGVVAPTKAIETAIRRHPAVADVAVTTHHDVSGTSLLVAHVVPHSGSRIVETELRSLARRHLPRKCVPRRFVEATRLPRLGDGTVNGTALPNPFLTREAAGGMAREPRNETEALLMNAWRNILGLESVGPQDNFFRLGGTSLLCFRVVEQVRVATGLHLNPRALLIGTLEQAAAELVSRQSQTDPALRSTGAEGQTGVLSRMRGLIR